MISWQRFVGRTAGKLGRPVNLCVEERMMTPQTRRTLVRLAVVLAFLFFATWLMIALESVTTTVLVAFFLAYLLNPLVERLESWGLNRSFASLLILMLGFAFIAGILLVIIPAALGEIAAFSREAPRYIAALQEYARNLQTRFQIALPQDWGDITPIIIEKLKQWLPTVANLSARFVASLFASTLRILSAILHLLLVPVIAYYLMVSFERIRISAVDLMPPYARTPIVEKLRQIDMVLAGFVRGQLTVAMILGLLYSLGFVLIGIDLAVVLGITSGILWIIPYLGTVFAVVVGSLIALAKYGDLVHVLYVIGWIGVVQIFEGYVLTPRVVGRAIGLNPVLYILALLAGAQLFGFVGLLVAIPVTAILKVLLLSAIEAYRNSYLYQEVPGDGPKTGLAKETCGDHSLTSERPAD
jgi:predicted PurR-regulated permease PerM